MARYERPPGVTAAIVLAAMLVSTPSTAVKLYKWKDEQGNVTYSQLPPPNSTSETLQLKGIQEGTSNTDAQERLDNLRDRAQAARKDREFKTEYQSESEARAKRIKENCETARENVRILETAARIKADDGSFIDEAQREQRLQGAKQQVEDYCS